MNKKKFFFKGLLKEIRGIGNHLSEFLCRQHGFKGNSKLGHFNKKQKESVINSIEDTNNFLIRDASTRFAKGQILKLLELRCFRGFRHRLGLPTRGQRTRTNRKTARKLNKIRF